MIDQTCHDKRSGEYDASRNGDLRGLLAMLDAPAVAATFDEGLNHLVISVAALRRAAAARS
jgi:hypothetical protein